MSFACHLYAICTSLVCSCMSFVCHSYVLVCHPYVTRMYSYVTRTYSYVIRKSLLCTHMSLVCSFTMNLKQLVLKETFKMLKICRWLWLPSRFYSLTDSLLVRKLCLFQHYLGLKLPNTYQ